MGMFSLSVVFACSLFHTSNAWWSLDSGPAPQAPPAPTELAPEPVLGPISQLYLTNEHIAPDGFNRSAVVANRVYPAPLIRGKKNDFFALQVYNQLTDDSMATETSIHWHGMWQHKTNWADGVAFVTQCPLRPNEGFTHRFKTNGQTGTYWYHSHYQTQYCDGLSGPLVIYDPWDPLKYLYDVDDENTIITLTDWYHLPSPVLIAAGGPVEPNSTLINGRGRYVGGPAVPFSVVNVRKGLRYRFRIVSMSCSPSFNFSIDGHRMTIIEADGNEVVPVEVDSIPIYAAQRYSVVVKANKQVGNYWIRALSSALPTFENGQNLAVLRYRGAPVQDPTSLPGPYILSFDEGDLHPLTDPRAPGIPVIGKADVNLLLQPGFTRRNPGEPPAFTFNNVTFGNPPPGQPVLLQILSGQFNASQLLPKGSIYELPKNKVVEISFSNPTNAPGGPHPIHLHGHSFSVVRHAGSNATNFWNPVRRDVVSLGTDATDNVTIRFVTDNPGPWIIHCHIDWHLNLGLAAVLAEAPKETYEEEARVVPPDWKRLCAPNHYWGQTVLSGRATEDSELELEE